MPLLERWSPFSEVDIIDRLPVPYGLIRTGVASLALDYPNQRSLHVTPTPRLGGIGIAAVAAHLGGGEVAQHHHARPICAFHDASGRLRLVVPFPKWEDFLRISLDEIRSAQPRRRQRQDE